MELSEPSRSMGGISKPGETSYFQRHRFRGPGCIGLFLSDIALIGIHVGLEYASRGPSGRKGRYRDLIYAIENI